METELQNERVISAKLRRRVNDLTDTIHALEEETCLMNERLHSPRVGDNAFLRRVEENEEVNEENVVNDHDENITLVQSPSIYPTSPTSVQLNGGKVNATEVEEKKEQEIQKTIAALEEALRMEVLRRNNLENKLVQVRDNAHLQQQQQQQQKVTTKSIKQQKEKQEMVRNSTSHVLNQIENMTCMVQQMSSTEFTLSSSSITRQMMDYEELMTCFMLENTEIDDDHDGEEEEVLMSRKDVMWFLNECKWRFETLKTDYGDKIGTMEESLGGVQEELEHVLKGFMEEEDDVVDHKEDVEDPDFEVGEEEEKTATAHRAVHDNTKSNSMEDIDDDDHHDPTSAEASSSTPFSPIVQLKTLEMNNFHQQRQQLQFEQFTNEETRNHYQEKEELLNARICELEEMVRNLSAASTNHANASTATTNNSLPESQAKMSQMEQHHSQEIERKDESDGNTHNISTICDLQQQVKEQTIIIESLQTQLNEKNNDTSLVCDLQKEFEKQCSTIESLQVQLNEQRHDASTVNDLQQTINEQHSTIESLQEQLSSIQLMSKEAEEKYTLTRDGDKARIKYLEGIVRDTRHALEASRKGHSSAVNGSGSDRSRYEPPSPSLKTLHDDGNGSDDAANTRTIIEGTEKQGGGENGFSSLIPSVSAFSPATTSSPLNPNIVRAIALSTPAGVKINNNHDHQLESAFHKMVALATALEHSENQRAVMLEQFQRERESYATKFQQLNELLKVFVASEADDNKGNQSAAT
uniref:Uncharacterized protein n=1 Tax=Ditylum brightwellii TaxID=49249 RepID=A0A7S4QL13_9STRA